MSEEIEAQVETPDVQEAAVPDVPQEAELEVQQEPETPFPKKAVNAITRRDRQIGQYRAKLSDAEKRMADLQKQLEEYTQKSQPQEINENDFDNYGDYLKALATHRPEQGQPSVDPEKLRQEAYQKAQQQFYYEQRTNAVAEQAQKAMQEVPGFQELVTEYGDVLDSFSPEIEMAFLSADNPPMAFLALAKEGRLETLAQMTPTQAAMEIARAQIRGEQMAKASKVSKAPQPIQGVKPTAAASKGVTDMSADELMKWVNS